MGFTTDNTNAISGLTVAELVDRFGATPMVLLAVWSHPDDESFLSGGFLAEVAARGGRVVNVAATSGEHGTSDPAIHPPAALASRRNEELDAALDVLGCGPAIRLGFGDGVCDRVPDELGARRIGSIIDAVAPDVVLTFGPDGVTGHADHRAIGRWTSRALTDRAGRIPLVTVASASAWPRSCIAGLHAITAFWPGFPVRVAEGHDVVVHLDEALTDRKLAALACHETQMGPVQEALGPQGYRLLASIEAYRPGNAVARRLLNEERQGRAA